MGADFTGLLGLTFCLAIVGSVAAAEPNGRPATTQAAKAFFKKPWLLGAHRGGAGLWPENTLVAFTESAKRWPDIVLESDARLTSDGQVILLHDASVDRTTDGTGPVADMSLEGVEALDAGFRFTRDGGKTFPYRGKGVRIPKLEEVLRALPGSRFEIELKPCSGVAEAVVGVITRLKAQDRVLLASFDPRLIQQARKLGPRIASCYDFPEGLAMLEALRHGGKAWQAYRRTSEVLSVMTNMLKTFSVTPEEIRLMQAKGVAFQVHTPNTRAKILQMLELNPDSILTDHPDLLAEILAERAKAK
jgi:glycerophosphoryl diester phosphodiesterase